MTFDPRLIAGLGAGGLGPSTAFSQRSYAASNPAAPAVGGGLTGALTNPLDPKYIDAHNGISDSVVRGQSVIITYGDGSTQVVPTSAFGEKEAASGGGYTGATGGQQLSYQQDMAALAEQQRQFDLTQGERKARGDQQMNLDTELGRGQLGVSQGNLGVAQGNLGVNQGRLTLDQQTQAYNQYKALADLASNPRNFVQTYFMNRGYTPPPDVARYGNTPSNAAGIMPYSQFAQQQGMFGGGAAPRPMAQAAPVANQFGSTQNNPMNPYAGTNVNYGGSPTVADTAMINGIKTWAGGAYSGKAVADSPANAGDLTPYLQNPNLPDPTGRVKPVRQFAKGGTLRMTGPHAVIDLMSGKIRAIAGEAGPENAYFDGAAIIDPGMQTNPYEPPPPAPTENPYGSGYGGYDYSAGFGGTAPDTSYGSGYGGYDYSANPTGSPSYPDTNPGQGYGGYDYSALQAQAAALAAQANAGNQQTTQTTAPDQFVSQPYVNQQFTNYAQPITAQPQAQTQQPIIDRGSAFNMGGTPEAPPVFQNAYSQFQQQQATPGGATPIDLAVGGSGQTALPTATNPQNASVPGSNAPTFGQPIPAGMPTYLAGENFQGSSDVLRGLQQGGAVPPFMSRIFGQARGDQKFATNTPQRTDLPPDLPLISQLGWEQLSPSEQQGFLSFASSLGVTPEDYLALVYGSSPQGGKAQAPLFGAPITYNRQ